MTPPSEAVAELATSRFGAKRLYRDAGSMAFSTAASAVLGLAFWAFAAKVFPPEKLGLMTAVLAVIVATALVVATGVGDAYTALLPAVGANRPKVYRRGQRIFVMLALVSGVGAAFATTTSLKEVRGSVGVNVLVAVGIVMWSAFLLQNSTLISLGRARWLPATNISISLGKILLLPLLATTLNWHSVELAFVIPAFAMSLVLRPMIGRIIDSGKDLPTTATIVPGRALGEFNRLVTQTVVSATLSIGALTVTPFLVTVFAGPKEGALFALSLTIVSTLDLIAAAMTVSLIVHASSTPEHANSMARDIFIKASVLTAIGAVVLIAVLPVALRILNPQYGQMAATSVIAVLCIGTVIRVVYAVWSGLQKSRRKMRMLLALNFITAGLLCALMPGLCGAHGAVGGALALLVAQAVLSAAAAAHFLITSRKGKDKGTCLATGTSGKLR